MILRLLGLVYAVAFLVAINQILPLIGSDGLLPAGSYLARVREFYGSNWEGFLHLPSLFWLGHSDAALLTLSWIGLLLSLVVLGGYANAIMLAVLWALYLSLVHVGQDWYGFGWESQLCETGFLAVFLVPLLDGRPFPRRAPPEPVIWLFRWLIFRVMVGAGLIKLRGDVVWRNLTALYYHFETQPLPNPLSRWFDFLPHLVLRAGVLVNDLAELVAPWFVFWQCLGRRIAGIVIIVFQGILILSGNLSFLNWLTIIPALACLDDGLWGRILPRSLVTRASAAASAAVPSRGQRWVTGAVTVLVVFLSVDPALNLISPRQRMNASFDRLDLVNTYGAFGTVGRVRYNVVFEGTDSVVPDDAAAWRPYPYKGLPVDVRTRPPQVAPYQLRLDWQMWFAAMGTPQQYPWTLHLVWKLLHNDPGALSLFARNPFPRRPPRYIRAVLWQYSFARPGNPDGRWWNRKRLGLWLPPLSVADPRLHQFLAAYGWWPSSAGHKSPGVGRRRS